VDGMALFDAAETAIVRLGGNDTAMLGGGFVFEGSNEHLLVNVLPPVMHIPAEQTAAVVSRETLAMLDRDLEQSHMGTSLMTQRLADIMLVQALRADVSEHGAGAAGWIGALANRQIGEALTLMHGDVAHGWMVSELASAVAMSRSAFALRSRQWRALRRLNICGAGGCSSPRTPCGEKHAR
jgi:hypothetical protein